MRVLLLVQSGLVRPSEVLLDVFLGHIANATFPARRRIVENIEDFELELMDIEKLLKVILDKNVFFIDVGIDEGDGGGIKGVSEGRMDDLDHECDSSTACNQVEVCSQTGGMMEVALGTLDMDGATNL